MGFKIFVSKLPRIVDWFTTGRMRSGTPALALTNTSGEPWSTSPFITPLDKHFHTDDITIHAVSGCVIQTAETKSRGSTVEVDGSVTHWERPSIAYYSEDELDCIMDGQNSRGEGTFYSPAYE